PYWFGAIAAANAMSDVYAMGGQVLMALNLVAFPDSLDLAILREILRGGAETLRAGGGVLAGGHTVTDDEPKYGLAVIGLVHPDRIMPKGGARPGDALVLTKPLGSGTITTALKNRKADPAHVEAAMRIMAALNKAGAEAGQAVGAHGMTDITGYGLIGHAYEMARLSGTVFHFQASAFPWMPGAREYGTADIFPGGQRRNRAYYGKWVTVRDGVEQVDPVTLNLLYDPQTSGGLLIAVDAARVDDLLGELAARGVTGAQVGSVHAADAPGIVVAG
ncbi:MAG: selenide, water dikinase SelD, partial [Anaerolineae bacterium]|nr:selenide, water dikinase SelD [Anaerolineae bacterium]